MEKTYEKGFSFAPLNTQNSPVIANVESSFLDMDVTIQKRLNTEGKLPESETKK